MTQMTASPTTKKKQLYRGKWSIKQPNMITSLLEVVTVGIMSAK